MSPTLGYPILDKHFVRYIPHMKRSGVAELPLHGGRVPPWPAERIAHEKAISGSLNGRSVSMTNFGPREEIDSRKTGQRSLF